MTLKELQIGKSAIVDAVGGAGALRQHFLDMGLIPGAEVTLVKLAPMGDPMELRIHGYELTLRLDDAAQITVTPTEKTPAVHAPVDGKMVEHPGLGEGGKYHTKEGEHPLPEDKTLTFALAGNQNCGKTTLFNQLTGSNQHVGNFPGVTVDRKSGAIKGHPETEVTDLPGIYSMSPYSSEEIVTRQFIIGEKPTGIINIVDATNIERNLYLTMQLMELDIPMVLALNMMDEMRGNGGTVRINKMEAMLGIPVIPISAAKNEGVDELVDHAVHVAKYQERPGRMDFCSEDDHGGAVHRCIHGILHLIEDHAKAAGIPVRFAATKLVEGDPRIEEALKLDPNEKEMIEHIIVQMEQERGLDRAAAIADMRFSFIQELVAQTVVKPHESKEQLRSNRIDKFLTGKYTAIPAFIAIMGLVFFLTFNVIGLFFQNLMEMGINALNIYGLSEVMGPGVAMECLESKCGMHLWEDHFLPEIIDPVTGEQLPEGEVGELVITTLTKEGIPLIRYRTRDLTSLDYTPCRCGRTHVRLTRIRGRSDDMLIIRGVNVFPQQIEALLMENQNLSPNYQIIVDRVNNLDTLEVQVEMNETLFADEIRKLQSLESSIQKSIKEFLGVTTKVRLMEPHSIQRSEGKAKRIIDKRPTE